MADQVVSVLVDYKGYKGQFTVQISERYKGASALDHALYLLKKGDMEAIVGGSIVPPNETMIDPYYELTNSEGKTVIASPSKISEYVVAMALADKPESLFERLKLVFK